MQRYVVQTFLILWLAAAPCRAVDLRLQENLISLRAELAPLRELLTAFTYAGVQVRMDPTLDVIVNARYTDEDIETALREMLDPLGYALIWDVVQGPVGPFPRLAEIQVFRPGEKKSMVPLDNPHENLRVTRGPGTQGPLYVEDELLIAVRPGISLADFKRLVAQVGGTVDGSCSELGVYRIRFMPGANIPALVEQLRDNPLVHTAEPNYAYQMPAPAPGGVSQSGSAAVTGTPADGSAPVAVLDSGLGASADLSAAIVGSLDAVHPDRQLTDALGHGTQMALIAAGVIAPEGVVGGDQFLTPVVAIRAFDDNGYASNFSLMRSIEYALSQGSRVLNLSWGSETDSKFLATAIAYAQSKGMAVVAAAGNEPTQRPQYPAAYPGVVAVAAAAPGGALWERSNYGSFVTLAAPGYAQLPVGYRGPPGSYAGTSIASAYVSRTLAGYFTRHPQATPKEAVAALTQSLTDAGDPGRDARYGHGLLDSAAAARFLTAR